MGLQIHQARWRRTLVAVRKQLNHCDPNAVGALSFHDLDSPPVCSVNGERLWAEYMLGSDHSDPWWSVQFTDTAFVVRDCESKLEIVPYASLSSIALPYNFSAAPDVILWREELFLCVSAVVTLHDGRTMPVHGGIKKERIREVFMWYDIVSSARSDAERHRVESAAGDQDVTTFNTPI